jgi:YHS domain-containing protein
MKLLAMALGLLVGLAPLPSDAGTSINTIGSADGIAIKGFDTVAFFTQKKAVAGSSAFSHEWAGATWLFASDANLQAFKQDPEKWAPQYGGHCAFGMSEGYLSKKPTNGDFEVMGEKLYLFPAGDHRGSTKDAWWRYGAGPKTRIADGNKHWPKHKSELEAK